MNEENDINQYWDEKIMSLIKNKYDELLHTKGSIQNNSIPLFTNQETTAIQRVKFISHLIPENIGICLKLGNISLMTNDTFLGSEYYINLIVNYKY